MNDLVSWFSSFRAWMSEGTRGEEAAEVCSDCASELYLNALAALHLRKYGQKSAPLFWARCEWGKVDICYGKAKTKFNSWAEADSSEGAGLLGMIEGKLAYWDESHGTHAERFRVLDDQLFERAQYEQTRGRDVDAFGMTWLVTSARDGDLETEAERLAWSGDNGWQRLFESPAAHGRFEPVDFADNGSPFHLIASKDLSATWPCKPSSVTSLYCSLSRWVPRSQASTA